MSICTRCDQQLDDYYPEDWDVLCDTCEINDEIWEEEL